MKVKILSESSSEISAPRNDEFTTGVRTPHFTTMQQNASGAFHTTSILQQFIPSGNSLSTEDQGRRLLSGGLLGTHNGATQDTWEKRAQQLSRAAQL
jgi:hypothetical protein